MRPAAVALVGALLLPCALLVADPGGYSPFGPSKWAAISVVGLLTIALALARRRIAVARRPVVVWAVLLAWVAVCAAVGLDHLYAWIGTPERHFGVATWVLCGLLFLAGQAVDEPGDARVVVAAGVVAGGASGLWATAEELGWHAIAGLTGSRLTGSMGSAAFLGAAMALLLPMAVGIAADHSWGRNVRRVAGVSAALMTVAAVGSGARAAWTGLAVGALAALWIHRDVVRRRFDLSTATAVIAAAAVIGVGAWTGVAGRVPAVFDSRNAGGSSRLAEWSVAAHVLAHHPVTGVGPEGYRIAFHDGATAHYVATYGVDPLPDRAHDSALDVAATTGVSGLVLYAGLLLLVGAFVLRGLRSGPPWLAGVAVGLVAYAAQALALFPLAELDPAAWFIAGVLVAQTATASELVSFRPARLLAAVAATAAVGAAVFGVRDMQADESTKASLSALAHAADLRAQRLADRAVRLRPDQIEYRIAASVADAAPATPNAIRAGLNELAAALRTAPSDPVLLDDRGQLLLELAQQSGAPADVAAARSALTTLVASDPFDPDDELRLGVIDAQSGIDGGAEHAWQLASELAPTSSSAPTDLAVLYLRQGKWTAAAAQARTALTRDPADVEAQDVAQEAAAHLGT